MHLIVKQHDQSCLCTLYLSILVIVCWNTTRLLQLLCELFLVRNIYVDVSRHETNHLIVP